MKPPQTSCPEGGSTKATDAEAEQGKRLIPASLLRQVYRSPSESGSARSAESRSSLLRVGTVGDGPAGTVSACANSIVDGPRIYINVERRSVDCEKRSLLMADRLCSTCGIFTTRAHDKCDSCYRYARRTGTERPAPLIYKAIERRIASRPEAYADD